ncbi:hypothetical protein DRO42_06050, partial [Candidatus Bathyarchaeota archaeon]
EAGDDVPLAAVKEGDDAGVVTLLDSGERYIISCFTREAADVYAAEEAIARASKAIYDHFSS